MQIIKVKKNVKMKQIGRQEADGTQLVWNEKEVGKNRRFRCVRNQAPFVCRETSVTQ